ncbi:MAG: ASPIC/UnbV domain-containing protein [Pirellulales bacterium]|nr:ASPIC/UnbV domain-containing protein [Pirellulales bacterium]
MNVLILGGDGYLAHNSSWIHFGLGAAAKIDKLVVTWPDGQQQTFDDVPIDQRVLVVQDRPMTFKFE